MKGFLTQKEVSERLGITRQTLWRWRRDGTGPPASKIGGSVLYDEEELGKWIEAQKEGSSDSVNEPAAS
jgi:excisionase family DNA binding protein